MVAAKREFRKAECPQGLLPAIVISPPNLVP
jgi:hypothetical protein